MMRNSRALSFILVFLLGCFLAACTPEPARKAGVNPPEPAAAEHRSSPSSSPPSGVKSEARVECQAVPSRILEREVRYCAILPPGYDADPARRFPVLYYLHGLGDNEQSLVNFGGWNILENAQRSGGAGEYLVVTPAGGRGFYINSKDGRNRYEDFFLREFLPAIEMRYRVQPGREHRGISGFSMGGYGALRLAFKHPDLFTSVSAHSAALMERLPRAAPNTPRLPMQISILGGVFGSPLDPVFFEQQSPFALARRQPAALKKLRIYFDCGDEDQYGFDTGARALHELLQSLGVPHEYRIDPGGHDPIYLAEHLPRTFEFHSRAFGLTK